MNLIYKNDIFTICENDGDGRKNPKKPVWLPSHPPSKIFRLTVFQDLQKNMAGSKVKGQYRMGARKILETNNLMTRIMTRNILLTRKKGDK